MAKPPAEDLETFLLRQDAADLVAVLLEFAGDHEAVQARLARMQLADRPDKLAAGFKKTLSGWRRSTRFHGYREAREFGRMLDGWLDQVARELLPKDPPGALSLFEAFIEADAAWFDHADDSDGVIGDAVRAACRHWLQAAARCETPRGARTGPRGVRAGRVHRQPAVRPGLRAGVANLSGGLGRALHRDLAFDALKTRGFAENGVFAAAPALSLIRHQARALVS